MSDLPAPRNRSAFRRVRLRPGRIVKLVILCLIVGLIFSALGIGPGDFWNAVGSFFGAIYDSLVSIMGSLAKYVVIGAAIVIPIWLARALWRRYRR